MGKIAQRLCVDVAIVFDDGPSATLLTRLDTLENLAEDWDGLWHLDHK
jgi:hypothetical protein